MDNSRKIPSTQYTKRAYHLAVITFIAITAFLAIGRLPADSEWEFLRLLLPYIITLIMVCVPLSIICVFLGIKELDRTNRLIAIFLNLMYLVYLAFHFTIGL